MASKHSISVCDELWTQLAAKAQLQGRSVDELAEDALRDSLAESEWRELLDYGLTRGAASGYSEAVVPLIVKEWRRSSR